LEEFFENEAVKRFEDMLENNEEVFFDTEEYEDIISYYLEIGDYQYAETAIKYAQKLYPDSVNIKVRRLEFLLEKEDNANAKILMKELAGIADDNLDFMICCAKYYSNMGIRERRLICVKKLWKKEDEDFIHNFIADEYKNLDDPFSALKHYKLALNFEPNDEYALESIMLCYTEMNRNEEALTLLMIIWIIIHSLKPHGTSMEFSISTKRIIRKRLKDLITCWQLILILWPFIPTKQLVMKR
jgi:tetratricopeptide (TPR) repeat protein